MRPVNVRRLTACAALVVIGGTLLSSATAHGDEDGCDPLFSARKFNSAPLAVDDEVWVAPGEEVLIDVLANDSDFDDDELIVESVSVSSAGSVSIQDGLIAFVADAGEGRANFTYRVSDQACGVDVATVRVIVAVEEEPEDRAEPPTPVTSVPDFAG